MSKRANPMAVKASLTYTVAEAALALGKAPATIRNWFKDGLPVMSSRKPYLISGAAIREYLRARYKNAKRPLGSDHLYCPSCRVGRRPLDMAATVSPLTARTSLLKGTCSHCGGAATRMISKAKAADFASTFKIKEEPESEALPPFTPHAFRKTLVKWADIRYPTREAFKAFSQNIGHSNVVTTVSAYCPVSIERQAELIKGKKRGE